MADLLDVKAQLGLLLVNSSTKNNNNKEVVCPG